MASQALIKAVGSARLTQVRLLLRMGADVNGRDSQGRTALMSALSLPHPKVRPIFLRLLLKAGAQVSLCDDLNRNALMWACRVGNVEDVGVLLRLADMDLNLNAQNRHGQTALWIAVQGGNTEIVRMLLDSMSDLALNFEVADESGITPAVLAAQLGHLDCLRAMMRHVTTSSRSIGTIINMTEIDRILKSMDIIGCSELMKEISLKESLEIVHLPPIARVTPSGLLMPDAAVPQDDQQSSTHSRHSSVDVPPIPTRSPGPEAFNTVGKSRIRVSRHTGNTSVLPRRRQKKINTDKCPRPEDSTTVEPVQDTDIIDGTSTTNRKLSSSSPMTWRSCDGQRGGLVLPPVYGATGLNGSVRHNLPFMFNIITQQTSRSFRNPAVRPPTPPPPPPRPPPSKQPRGNARGGKWTKLRGIAMITGLGKLVDKTKVSRSGNTVKGSTTGVLKLLMTKRRLSGAMK